MSSQTITSVTVTEKKTSFATEDDWRTYTQFTDSTEFPSDVVQEKLELASEQVKKDAFMSIRLEFVTKDSNNRYFVSRRWLANAYGGDVAHGVVTPRDLRIWESDETSSVSSAFFLQGSRVNRLIHSIPSEAITQFDDVNGYFILSSAYPTNSNFRIFVDYWTAGKRFSEIQEDLKNATILWATVLILTQYKKTGRIKNGVVSLSQGGRTINRSEQDFDALTRQWYNEYEKIVNWLKPFYGRKVAIGKWGSKMTENYPVQGKMNYF